MRNTRRLSLTATLVLLAVAPALARAADPAEIVKYREAVMKANGAHMAAAAAIISGKVDYKADLGEHVKALQATTREARFGELADACKACHKDFRMNPK